MPYGHAMNGLRLAGIGMIVILADLKIDGFDLIVDAVGWVLVYVGLTRLSRLIADFKPARIATAPAMLFSLLEFTRAEGVPAQTIAIVAPITTEAVVVVLTCAALMRVAKRAGDEATAATAGHVRLANLMMTLIAVVLTILAESEPSDVTGDWAGLLVLLFVIAGFAASLWFIALLVSRADRPYLQNPSLTEAEVG